MTLPSTDRAPVPQDPQTLEWKRRVLNSSGYWLPAGTFVGIIVLWELATRIFGIPRYIVPAPSAIVATTIEQWAMLIDHSLVTLYSTLGGFALSVVVGVGLAIVMTQSRFLFDAINPLLVVSQSIPKIVVAPIILLVLGYGDLSKIFIAFTMGFFPIVVSSATGLASTPKELIELSRSYRASRIKTLVKITIPTALPHIFSGLKVGLVLTLVGAVVAEFVGSSEGLGYVVVSASSVFNSELAFGAIAVLSLMSVGLYAVLERVEKWLCPWYAAK